MPEQDIAQLKIDKTQPSFRGAGWKRYRVWIVAAILVMIVGVLAFFGVLSPAVTVETARVTLMYPSQGFTLLNASGYVVAQRKAAVASKVTGRLVALFVEEGSRVRAGQVIAELENDDLLAARKQAEANVGVARQHLDQANAELRDAELTFSRNRELIDKGYVSQAEYDASEARLKKARAAVGAAEASIQAAEAALGAADVAFQYTFIRAPFDAVVLTKNADIGDIVTPIGAATNAKAAVVTIADMDSLQVEVDVAESNLHLVKRGQPCEIQLDALPGVRFRGKVHTIVPTADRTKATIMVKVRFEEKDDRVLPEMSAKVAFLSRGVLPHEEKPRIALTPDAIVRRDRQSVVYLVSGNIVEERAVQTGEKLGDMIEITQGLEPGDTVVLKPLTRLKHGARVKIAET